MNLLHLLPQPYQQTLLQELKYTTDLPQGNSSFHLLYT